MEDEIKIIEIYMTKDEETDSTTFNFTKLNDSEEANFMMKMLLKMLAIHKKDDDKLEINVKE